MIDKDSPESTSAEAKEPCESAAVCLAANDGAPGPDVTEILAGNEREASQPSKESESLHRVEAKSEAITPETSEPIAGTVKLPSRTDPLEPVIESISHWGVWLDLPLLLEPAPAAAQDELASSGNSIEEPLPEAPSVELGGTMEPELGPFIPSGKSSDLSSRTLRHPGVTPEACFQHDSRNDEKLGDSESRHSRSGIMPFGTAPEPAPPVVDEPESIAVPVPAEQRPGTDIVTKGAPTVEPVEYPEIAPERDWLVARIEALATTEEVAGPPHRDAGIAGETPTEDADPRPGTETHVFQSAIIAEPVVVAETAAASSPQAPLIGDGLESTSLPHPIPLVGHDPSRPEPVFSQRIGRNADFAEQTPIELVPRFAVRRPAPHAAGTTVAQDYSPALAPPHAPIGVRTTPAQLIAKAARIAGRALGAYLALVLALLVVYRFVDPPASTLMLFQGLTGTEIRREWVDLQDVSPHLVRAVLVAEDGRFCEHRGIDLAAMEEAIEKAADGVPRGASTISMQVIKNLFLWQSKSYVRKVLELPLTLLMEVLWPKSRILEIYLNIAEWGPGVFGAEAAAQYHFSKPASKLGEREAAQLAASLPNPMIRDAGDPGPRTARKASVIQSRVRAGGDVAHCIYSRD